MPEERPKKKLRVALGQDTSGGFACAVVGLFGNQPGASHKGNSG